MPENHDTTYRPEKYEIVLEHRNLGLPKVGGKIKMKEEPKEVLERITGDFKKGLAFMINPNEKPKYPWTYEAGLQLGTMILNFRISTRGKSIFGIGYKNRTTIDVLLETQSQALLDMLEAEGIHETVYLLTVKDKPKYKELVKKMREQAKQEGSYPTRDEKAAHC